MTSNKQIGILSLPVLVAALGYFVDVYDLLLFTIVRQPSVMSLGATAETIIVDSAHIINWQMSGLLIGGILWGVLGDKKGRLKVLFGSIILYSTANFLTSFVQTVDQYAYCRFFCFHIFYLGCLLLPSTHVMSYLLTNQILMV